MRKKDIKRIQMTFSGRFAHLFAIRPIMWMLASTASYRPPKHLNIARAKAYRAPEADGRDDTIPGIIANGRGNAVKNFSEIIGCEQRLQQSSVPCGIIHRGSME